MVTQRQRASKAPFPWYGGKQQLAPLLVDLLPPHDGYVEVFGGAASLLFAKTPSRLEVYNDLHSGCVNFFRVLRDPQRSRELLRLLELTPYARAEWQECRAGWWRAGSDVEMARQWYVAVVGSFGKHIKASTGWSFSKTLGHDKAHSFRAGNAALEAFVWRLRHVQVEEGDFARVMTLYDTPTTLFYLDPPYLPETRQRADRYAEEMTREDHERLLEVACSVRGMVVLSGYRSLLYDHRLRARDGWRRVEIPVLTSVAHAGKPRRVERTECVWLSPRCTEHQPELPFFDNGWMTEG